jgi:hypothetical protein
MMLYNFASVIGTLSRGYTNVRVQVVHDVVEVLIGMGRKRQQLSRRVTIDGSVRIEAVRVKSYDSEETVDEADREIGEVFSLREDEEVLALAKNLSNDERRAAGGFLDDAG